MFKYLFKLFFSCKGRIRRLDYFLALVVLTGFQFVNAILFYEAYLYPYPIMELITWILIYCFIAAGIKRCHDIGNSGWWFLIPLYPLLIILIKGESGENEYGKEPEV